MPSSALTLSSPVFFLYFPRQPVDQLCNQLVARIGQAAYRSFCIWRRRGLLPAETALCHYGTGRAIDKAGAESHHHAALMGGVESLGEFSKLDTQNVIRASAISG